MQQRGRKGAVSRVVPLVDGAPPRLEAPATLSETERVIFESLVASVDRRHFRPSDSPLLATYCRAINFEQEAAKQLALNPADARQLIVWEKASKIFANLAVKLRLAPQSRQHPRTTGRMVPSIPTPWAD